MKNKLLKLSLITAIGLLAAALIAGFAFAAGETPAAAPKATTTVTVPGVNATGANGGATYVGSKACLGCHANRYTSWDDHPHSSMVKPLVKNSDFPADPTTADSKLQAELTKAEYMIGNERFITRTAAGDYVYTGAEFVNGQYVAYSGAGRSWTTGCAGCHTTGWNSKTATFSEPGIGCEACHGPGSLHIAGKGDVSKITANPSSDTCGQCHSNGKSAAGTAWAEGHDPAKTLVSEGFQFNPAPANSAGYPGVRQENGVIASGHANAMKDLLSSDHANGDCAKCHSGAIRGEYNRRPGPAPADWKSETDGVSCVACHSAHSDKLSAPRDQVCTQCHTAELAEGASFKPGATAHHPMKEMLAGTAGLGTDGKPVTLPSVHNGDNATCVDCHMTGGNHFFKVVMPKDVAGTKTVDTCSTCHTAGGKASASSPEIRQFYLDLWQTQTKTKLAVVNDLLTKADAKLKATPNDALKAKRDIAYTNISFVTADGSTGAHNFEYAMKLLGVAETNLKDVLK